jgi:hypothetical protein
MRKILDEAQIIQKPIPGELKRMLEVKVLGPSDSQRSRMEPDGELPVVQLNILEQYAPDDEEFEDERASIQVPLRDLLLALGKGRI